MFVVAAKAGLGFAVILSILGVVETHSITETFMLFAAAGLIPGLNVEIPAEATLVIVGGALMLIIAILYRDHVVRQAALRAVMPEYVREYDEDPDFGALVPGLSRLRAIYGSAMSAANDASLVFYFWLRNFGRPVAAQAIAVRQGMTITIVRFDRWATAKINLRENLEVLQAFVRAQADKARTYLIRLTVR